MAKGFPVANYAVDASPEAPDPDKMRKEEPYRETMGTLVASTRIAATHVAPNAVAEAFVGCCAVRSTSRACRGRIEVD
jgi:hypothetical protein